MTTPTPVLLLDIDGTVRHGKTELGRFVNTPADVTVFPEAAEMMRRWRRSGGRIVGVSNQGGIALGHVTVDHVRAAMEETSRLAGGLFDALRVCPHHPAKQPFWCRKPRPGMLIEGLHVLMRDHPGEEYPPDLAVMVGHRPEDEQCARAAGVDFLDAAEWRRQAALRSHDAV